MIRNAAGGKQSVCGIDIADILSFTQQLSMARGIQEITALVRTTARRLTDADGITFVLREGDMCFYADEDAISPLWKGQRFPAETCISGWAMINRQPAVIEDIYADSRIPHDAYRLTFVKSLVMVPVRKEDPVAAIGAYWAKRRRPSRTQVEMLENIANAAAVAMTNVALVNGLRRAADEACALADQASRHAAELVHAKAELERVAAQKSRFLAACSHDLRQPFQAMRLFHAVLAQRARDDDRDVIDRLGQAIAQGEDLLHSLLDVSTIESGLEPMHPAEIALDEVFARLRATFAESAQAKGLSLRFRPSAALVVSDPILLTRILGNLVGNAIKYTRRGGILVAARRHRDRVAIEVWDTGIGIPRDRLGDIFEDFYQVANSERDKTQGIGLGLGIVRRLAENLGHTVTVRSQEGRGSVFRLTVPCS